MEEKPIEETVERLDNLRHEHIPAEVDDALHAVRGDLESLREIVRGAGVPDVTAQLDDIAAEMLEQVRGIGDAAGAAVSTGASELTALLRPDLHISSTSPEHRPTLRNPPEDRVIIVDHAFTYTTGERGRTITVRAELTERPPGTRNRPAQQNLRGKLDGDDAGHLISRVLGGPGHELNLVAMEGAKVNRVKYRRVERAWERAVEAQKTVNVTIHANYVDGGFRPPTLISATRSTARSSL